MAEYIPSPPTNSQALASFVFAILTPITFCAGVVPIPFTALICFPATFLFALLSFIMGLTALGQIRRRGESGGAFAWIGIVTGGLTLLVSICAVIAVIVFLASSTQPIHFPPFQSPFGNYQT